MYSAQKLAQNTQKLIKVSKILNKNALKQQMACVKLAKQPKFNYIQVTKKQQNSGLQQQQKFNHKVTFKFSYPSHEKMAMPALSPTMEKGSIQKWNFKEGDALSSGDVLCEVETDKSTVGFEVTEDMVLAKILVPEGEEVEVGAIVAISVEEAGDVAAFKNFSLDGEAASESQPQQKQEQQQQTQQQQQPASSSSSSSMSFPTHEKMAMPALSPTMEKGSIQKWNFKEGDELSSGDVLCEVETDKSTVGFEVTEDMVLAKILVPEGQEIEVGGIVAIAVDDAKDVPAFKNYSLEAEQQQQSSSAPQQQQQSQQQSQSSPQRSSSPSSSSNDNRVKASPLARKTAYEQGIDINQYKQGSGPGGRIVKDDLKTPPPQQQQQQQQAPPVQQQQQFQAPPVQQQQQQAPPAQQQQQQQAAPVQQQQKKQDGQFEFQQVVGQNPYYDVPNSGMRKTIASRLVESKNTAPGFYLSVEVSVDNLMKFRKELNSNQDEVKISVNDFIVKACSLALRDYPQANCQWQGDKIRYFQNADISVAVSTDGGLITPIVFEANKKGLKEISREVKSLAKKARDNKLSPKEYQGGTFSISNLGMFGIDAFTSILNPPQACILAVSQGNKKVVYDPTKADTDAPYKVSTVMNLTMTCDHRAVDGAVGAQFLQKLKFYIENPANLLL